MAWFQKKKSPVDRRLDELNQQIADLETQLRQQQEEDLRRAAESAEAAPPQEPSPEHSVPASPEPEPPKSAARPRFRTTVTPRGVSPVHGIEPHEVDFFARKDKSVDFGLESRPAPASKRSEPAQETPAESKVLRFLNDVFDLFGKPKPQSQQQQLASYLTTGSFQRLKPLRYEKRVARTRLIILLVILAVIVVLIVKFVMR